MNYSEDALLSAHRHCADHRAEIEASTLCRCFYCLDTFSPRAIERWLKEGSGTACCPSCQIDSVIGDRSGYPVDRDDFARAMHERWFERTYPLGAEPGVREVREPSEALQVEATDDPRRHFTPEQLASIERGLADIEAGRVVDHDELFARLEAKYGG